MPIDRFSAARGSDGSVLQSGLAKRPRDPEGHRPAGLLLRAVVTATYTVDDDNHPYKNYSGTDDGSPVAVYCDVVCYSALPKMRRAILRTVLVSQPRGGLHDGVIWKPRAAKNDISGNPLDLAAKVDPALMDGDHVLIGFMDDTFQMPIILRGIPHPKADVGNTESGRQLKLKLADGDPEFAKHHGSLYGIADNGDFLVDTRFANDGELGGDGHEAEAPTDGKGSVLFRLPDGSTFTIEVDGDASKHVAIVEELKQLYNDLKSYIEGAKVPTAMGPSGTINAGSGPAPSWNEAIKSERVIIPKNP